MNECCQTKKKIMSRKVQIYMHIGSILRHSAHAAKSTVTES